MRNKTWKILTVLCLLSIAISSCTAKNNVNESTPSDWSNDLTQLIDEIKLRNPDVFDRIDEKEFLDRVNILRRDGETLSEPQRGIELARLIASLKQTHSYIQLDADNPGLFSDELGIEIQRFEEGFFVTCATNENRDLFGKRLTALGGVAVNDLYDEISNLSGADNVWAHQLFDTRRMNLIKLLDELGSSTANNTLEVTFDDGKAQRSTLVPTKEVDENCEDFRDIGSLKSSLFWKDQDTAYWTEILKGRRTLYFQFNVVAESDQEKYSDFTKRLNHQLNSENPTRLIIDLRRNIGGNAIPARIISSTLLQHDAFQEQGAIRILVSPETLSASVVFIQELSLFAPAILIGEPTGSDGNQWGDNQFFELANSGWPVSIATAFYQTGGPYAGRKALEPYVYIPARADDFFATQDSVLDAAIEFELDPSLEEVFRTAQANSSDPIKAVLDFVNNPQRQFRDIERPLRLFSRFVETEMDTEKALIITNLLVDRYPNRARAYMERATTFETLGQLDKAISDWEMAIRKIDGDTSLTSPLRFRLRNYAVENLKQLRESKL